VFEPAIQFANTGLLTKIEAGGVDLDRDRRRVLGDDPKDPTYIVNILRRGYRLVAAVAPWMEAPAAVPEPPANPPAPLATASPRVPWRRILRLGLVLSIVLAVPVAYFSSRPQRKVMLAVMPFANLTGDAQREYFSDGMTEELISQLGSLDPVHLGVIARTCRWR
jgi:hypothetical protein